MLRKQADRTGNKRQACKQWWIAAGCLLAGMVLVLLASCGSEVGVVADTSMADPDTPAVLSVTARAAARLDMTEDAVIELTLDKSPLQNITLDITTNPTTATKMVTFMTSDSGSDLTKTVSFTTGSGADITAIGNYVLDITVPADVAELITLPPAVTFQSLNRAAQL